MYLIGLILCFCLGVTTYLSKSWWLTWLQVWLRQLFIRHGNIIIPPLMQILTAMGQIAAQEPLKMRYELMPGGRIAKYRLDIAAPDHEVYSLLLNYDCMGPNLSRVEAHYNNGDVKNILQPPGISYDFCPDDIRAHVIKVWTRDLVTDDEQLVANITGKERLQVVLNQLDLN